MMVLPPSSEPELMPQGGHRRHDGDAAAATSLHESR